MLGLIALFWYKSESSIWRPVLFPVWVVLTFYVNMPNFLYIADGTKLKDLFLIKLIFECYKNFNWTYILLSNLCMALAGLYFSNPEGLKNIYTKNQIKNKFDSFIMNATEVKIIGRDLDFLKDESFAQQRNVIEKLKSKSKLLCEHTDNPELIDLYQQLLDKGVQVRSYSFREGIANLKGQIKITDHNEHSGIFVLKSTERPGSFPYNVISLFKKIETYYLTEMENSYLLDSVSRSFDETFRNSLNPVIKFIALDLGGVYFDGNIDDFYKFLQNNYKVTVKPDKNDRLNIDNEFVLGKCDIKELITKRATTREKLNELKEQDWEVIYNEWQNTWKPNTKMKKLMEDLNDLGYEIIPFSNLDRQNGDKYLRDSYFPKCCKRFYLSYERNKCKPDEECFKDFEAFVCEDGIVIRGYQILLIDDEPDNLMLAKSLNWSNIYYNSNTEKPEKLVVELKKIGVLPQCYKLT